MSSVFTPRSRSTAYSASPKSSPTGPTTRTSVKKLAASEKWTAVPPSIRSRSPNGVRTASNAIDPTTTRLMRPGSLSSPPMSLMLAFASSVAWGTADFIGGLKSRTLPVLNVLLASQLTGLLLIALFVALRGDPAPGGDFAVFAALSALAGVTGLAAFYRALAVGNMGIVAPISACAAIVPVVVGVATGDRPSAAQAAGLVLALGGVVLASREEAEGPGGRTAPGAGLAVVSALGFGFFFLAMDRASDADIGWAILVNRITGVTLLALAAAALRPPLRAGRRDLPVLMLIG